MSTLIDLYSFEVMEDAIVESVSSEAINHPAEHAVSPLESSFSWEANEASTQHEIVIDLGEPRTCDGFCYRHHEVEQTTPVTLGVDITIKYSYDAVTWTSITLALNSDGTDSPADTNDATIALKLRHFEDGSNNLQSVTARYWQFTIEGTAGPFFYAPIDCRISILWLFELDQLDRGAAFPVDDTPVYPADVQSLPFGKVYRTGHSVNPYTPFTRTWMVTSTEYAVLQELMRKCNGAQRPFILVDNDDVRRLCKFASDEIDEMLLDDGLYRVTFRFVELPLIGKDKYH